MSDGPIRGNRYKEAINESFNLVGLASAAAVSAAMLNPLPLLGAIVLEAFYIAFVPDSKWYARRLERRFDNEIIARREALKKKVLPQVRGEVKDRYIRLETMRRTIETQTEQETPWFREAMRKLDFLLEKYLQFASKEVQFAGYLTALRQDAEAETEEERAPKPKKGAKPNFDVSRAPKPPLSTEWIDDQVDAIKAYYTDEIGAIDAMVESKPDFPTRNVVGKRREILERRRAYVDRIGLILHNLGGQMALMSDTLGLINDEMRARSPEQVLADIDEVVNASNSLSEAIDEITPVDELVARLGA